MLHNGAVYGHAGLNGMSFYHQNIRPGRRHDNSEATLALRSPLLDEFRVNKTRKWELRVCLYYYYSYESARSDQSDRTFLAMWLSSVETSMARGLFNRSWRQQLQRKSKLYLMKLCPTAHYSLFKMSLGTMSVWIFGGHHC